MKYQLAIFDLDGTILDTLQDLADSVNYALGQNGLALHTVEEIRSYIGNGIKNLIDRSVPQNTSEEVTARVFSTFKAHYAEHCADKTCPYEGILPLLEKIRSAGIKTAVLSNKADFAVQELVKRYFDGLIDYAAGEKPGVPKKPAPDSIRFLLDTLRIPDEKAVYIGDSEVDILTAQNAELDCLIVDWGFRDRETLVQAGAERIFSSADALLEALLQK